MPRKANVDMRFFICFAMKNQQLFHYIATPSCLTYIRWRSWGAFGRILKDSKAEERVNSAHTYNTLLTQAACLDWHWTNTLNCKLKLLDFNAYLRWRRWRACGRILKGYEEEQTTTWFMIQCVLRSDQWRCCKRRHCKLVSPLTYLRSWCGGVL